MVIKMKKNLGKIILGVVALALIIGAIRLVKLIAVGAFSLVSGAFNVVLAVVVIVALIAIVIWMFAYAAKMNK